MLAIKTILHPTDFSDNAAPAFQLACTLARDCDADLLVLHVMPPPLHQELMEARHHPEEFYGARWKALRKIQPPDPGTRVDHWLAEGDAAAEILRVAEEVQCDLIVMGTHGRTGLARL